MNAAKRGSISLLATNQFVYIVVSKAKLCNVKPGPIAQPGEANGLFHMDYAWIESKLFRHAVPLL